MGEKTALGKTGIGKTRIKNNGGEKTGEKRPGVKDLAPLCVPSILSICCDGISFMINKQFLLPVKL